MAKKTEKKPEAKTMTGNALEQYRLLVAQQEEARTKLTDSLKSRRSEVLAELSELDAALGLSSVKARTSSSGKGSRGPRGESVKALVLECLKSGKKTIADLQNFVDGRKGKEVKGVGVALSQMKKEGSIKNPERGVYSL